MAKFLNLTHNFQISTFWAKPSSFNKIIKLRLDYNFGYASYFLMIIFAAVTQLNSY